MCVSGATCAFTVRAAPGGRIVFATLVDVDERGTADTADDASEVIGFALSEPLALASEETADVTLDVALDAVGMALTLDDPPGGLTQVVGVPGARDAATGQVLVIPFGTRGRAGTVYVPALEGAAYWAIGRAVDDSGACASARVARGIADPSSPTALGAWAELPTPSATETELSLGPSDAALRDVRIGRWRVLSFGGADTIDFALADPATVTSGDTATVTDVVAPTDMELAAITAEMTAAAWCSAAVP